MKDYHKPGYWKDWYWNKGGRERVQSQRKITEYNRYKKNLSNVDKFLCEDNSFKGKEERT